tara:strand:- start:192 stop:329 length:138 start_codon:yes stop_codon:yes gene_type:complete
VRTQFVFDFDAVKALMGDDRSFTLEILVRRTCHHFAPAQCVHDLL